ncbi:uncharacterized protein LOC127466549 isoform X2 [Manacus candei]|uniref:uncharacterized protein LOC127466549 isoform X2 n=1 Tax=Manacus candei TaxID=415023 RepID=UPI002225C97C|nr:uncharacterized protein LOC127466549 isoform X2 [Manacus candei]
MQPVRARTLPMGGAAGTALGGPARQAATSPRAPWLQPPGPERDEGVLLLLLLLLLLSEGLKAFEPHAQEASGQCGEKCRKSSCRPLIAGVVLLDDSLWEEISGKPRFQYSGEDYGSHCNQLAERWQNCSLAWRRGISTSSFPFWTGVDRFLPRTDVFYSTSNTSHGRMSETFYCEGFVLCIHSSPDVFQDFPFPKIQDQIGACIKMAAEIGVAVFQF